MQSGGWDKLLMMPELRIECPDDQKFSVIDRLADEAKTRFGDDSLSLIDGVRVQTDDGWWLLWSSNTQDVLVARCEAATEEGLQRLKDALAEQVRLSGIEPPSF